MASLRIAARHSFRQNRHVHSTRPRSRLTRLNAHPTHERVLRYPDGHERRIIYPVVATFDEDDDEYSSWDVVGLWGSRGSQRQQRVQTTNQPLSNQKSSQPAPSLQDTAAFLEGLFAASYASQPAVDVDQCYKVLDGCPWLLPRPVFVLTSRQWGVQAAEGIQSSYTLRVKVPNEGAADAIAKLLNKQHLSAALDVAELRDGLVMFESAEDADKFASMLEEEGHSQVNVAEVDSHKAFRMVADVKGLVVLLPLGGTIPAPYQLAVSLKKQQSWDNL